jgi:hypothetical protein
MTFRSNLVVGRIVEALTRLAQACLFAAFISGHEELPAAAAEGDEADEPVVAGQEGEDSPAPTTGTPPPEGSAGAALLAEVNRELSVMKSSAYSHRTHVDEASGLFDYDCSGLLNYGLALDQHRPHHDCAWRADSGSRAVGRFCRSRRRLDGARARFQRRARQRAPNGARTRNDCPTHRPRGSTDRLPLVSGKKVTRQDDENRLRTTALERHEWASLAYGRRDPRQDGAVVGNMETLLEGSMTSSPGSR